MVLDLEVAVICDIKEFTRCKLFDYKMVCVSNLKASN